MLKTMVDFRAIQLYKNNECVNQVCVSGVAVELFWDLAFHQRRGLSGCVWSDVTSVELWDVMKKTVTGTLKRMGTVEIKVTPADSQFSFGDITRYLCRKRAKQDCLEEAFVSKDKTT